jgi:hypothetical protein
MPLFAPPSIAGMRILADGRDGFEGRALLLISALHLAARSLQDVEIRVLGGRDVVIQVAVEALRRETGLSITLVPADADFRTELAGARWFVDPHDVAALADAIRIATTDNALVDDAAIRNREAIERRWNIADDRAAALAIYDASIGGRA